MTIYRCPYCREGFAEKPSGKCPACGRALAVLAGSPEERRTRRRAKERIWREAERQKAALGASPPGGGRRNPRVYLAAVLLLAVLGGLLLKAAGAASSRKAGNPLLRAMRHVDTLATALGRYRFHTGRYPDARQGLNALVRDPLDAPGWDGPYVSHIATDLWDTPYVYRPDTPANGHPLVYSCGPDRRPGTPDDIHPDPACFDPGTAWTNGWVSAARRTRGVRVLTEKETAQGGIHP